ncbi:hypothetical protein HMF8227_01016 [Saliniradius amylolyticus]|uniref:DUF819 family protein n=1 Tax=Saliniradius amylolyticus TaxID=2183582 RepID=A0A2S2E1H7_9ALTE|nr:DUF819 family protein [Saliniradius amylolyticus]AWL11505.1 hypothetical protein HMF8227_01016 [Saliniradius amylolyticus]
MTHSPLITNDAIVFGILFVFLGLIFYTAGSPNRFFQAFYKYVPALLLCYFLPSLLNTFNIVDSHESQAYFVASRFLLPACLVLLTLSMDLRSVFNLGPKALILFLTGTVGIVIGGPIALLIVSSFSPELLGGQGPDAVWRGLTTVAGSWIGGGANQAAMKEIFEVGGGIFSTMVTVDIIVANLWMAVLLIMASNAKKLDARTGADTSAITEMVEKVEHFQREKSRIPTLRDIVLILAVGMGACGLAHAIAETVQPWMVENAPWGQQYSLHSKFFWLVVSATTMGIALSFSKARNLEQVGASKVGSLFVYVLVTTIGLHMDVTKITETPIFFLIGIIWMLIHAGLMLGVAKLLRAPVFYMAVGSQANVGGAASAPVVAAAFHPSLAPVGVLLAVMGYALGTYMAYFCGVILQGVAG